MILYYIFRCEGWKNINIRDLLGFIAYVLKLDKNFDLLKTKGFDLITFLPIKVLIY